MKKLMARTIKEISGKSIDTIPKGTEFELKCLGENYSPCKEGLGITSIWNDEFELIGEGEQKEMI